MPNYVKITQNKVKYISLTRVENPGISWVELDIKSIDVFDTDVKYTESNIY